jgi:hypothetical protein
LAQAGQPVCLEALAEQAETWGEADAPPLLLGYTDPLHVLRSLTASDADDPDPLALLETWLSTTARFLDWKQRWPEQVRLLHLRPPAEAAAAETEAEAEADLDPRLLAVLHALPQLAERHADLEACADLEGQEPRFSLGLPPLRSGAFASLCLESWRRDRQALLDLRQQSVEQLQGLGSQLEGMRSQLEDMRSQLEDTHTQLAETRTELADTRSERDGLLSERDDREEDRIKLQEAEAASAEAVEAAEQRSQELEQALQHTQAASEVTLAQLHAVQDTMEQLYGERRRIEDALHRISAEREHLGNEAASLRHELEALQSEVAHYLRASTPRPQLDRSRIPRLTALLRDALHLH